MSRVQEDYFRYVPIRQRDVDWGLYVTGAGCSAMPAGYTLYPVVPHPTTYDFSWRTGRKLPEYQAIYVTCGRGEFESTPTGRVEVGPGTLLMLFPDVWHRYRPSTETGWDEYWVSFAQTGIPSVNGSPEWIPYNTADRPVLLLDAVCRMEDSFDDEIRQLWLDP